MKNKDYERLTFQHIRHGGIICGVGLKANSEEIAERLYALEEMIENGTLVFLPCKVGDILWQIHGFYPAKPIEEVVVDSIEFMRNDYICIRVHAIYQQYGTSLCANDIGKDFFTTREAAEKALEKLGK